MNKNLILVFIKNPVLGKVKTRLAKDIGDKAALDIYLELLKITKKEIDQVEFADVHVLLSDHLDKDFWPDYRQYLQVNGDLGTKMLEAFKSGFKHGYKNIICIGTDLPDLHVNFLRKAFENLTDTDTVFGPAIDGGYYLVGMNRLIESIFLNKKWSTEELYQQTKEELVNIGWSISELQVLNDIDNLEDLKSSSLNSNFQELLNNTYSE